jgi:hypothetical protein
LNSKLQLLIALSIYEAQPFEETAAQETDEVQSTPTLLLKQKLIEYFQSGSNKAEALEDYITHRLQYIFATKSDFESPSPLESAST